MNCEKYIRKHSWTQRGREGEGGSKGGELDEMSTCWPCIQLMKTLFYPHSLVTHDPPHHTAPGPYGTTTERSRAYMKAHELISSRTSFILMWCITHAHHPSVCAYTYDTMHYIYIRGQYHPSHRNRVAGL